MPGSATILFVDDEPRVLDALRRTFFQSPHVIFTAHSAREALSILLDREVDVVVSDLRMPHMNGIDFLHQVRSRWPGVVRIVLTGDGRTKAIEQALRCGDVFRYLTKPWNRLDFEAILDQALTERSLSCEAVVSGDRNRPVFTLRLMRNLKERFVKEGHIDTDRLQRACEVTSASGASLGDVLLRLGYITEDKLLDFISRHANLPRVRLADMQEDPNVIAMVPPELMERYRLLPLSRHGSRVVVAMADAANLMIIDEIRAFLGIEIEPVLCTESELREALSRRVARSGFGVKATDPFKESQALQHNEERSPVS